MGDESMQQRRVQTPSSTPFHDDDEHFDDAGGSNRNKRSSRACDPCRRAKSRCEPSADDGPCKGCIFSGTECTFQGAAQRRGPPKGYLNAMETRLHEAEALLGAIIGLPKAECIVSALRKDPLAERIMTRISKSIFDHLGRPRTEQEAAPRPKGRRRPDKERLVMASNEVVYSQGNDTPIFTSPSYAWQDHITRLIDREVPIPTTTSMQQSDSIRASSSIPMDTPGPIDTAPGMSMDPLYSEESLHKRKRRRLNESPSQSVQTGDDEAYGTPVVPDAASDPVVDYSGVGQLCFISDTNQVRYLGESSCLPLLAHCPRVDTLYTQQVWRISAVPEMAASIKARRLSYANIDKQLYYPDQSVQEHLLRLYFHYVHPILPVIDKGYIWDEWSGMHKGTSDGPPKVLLFAMFAVTLKYSDDASAFASFDNSYTRNAKLLVDAAPFSDFSTCQALLLLSYASIGFDGLTDASILLATGIQMAFDLGLNRLSDEWASGRTYVIPEKFLKLRKSVWYGYVFLDSLISAQFGCPLRIRREDYDEGLLPETDTHADVQVWMPHKATVSPDYTPVSNRIMNCFQALSSLAEYTNVVIRKLYGLRPEKGYTISLEMDQKLQRWYVDLPEVLRMNSTAVVLPHILCMHLQYWCTVLLVHRSLLSCRGANSEQNMPSEFGRALNLASTAATNIANLAYTFQSTFSLQYAPPTMPYYLMLAGSTYVTVLHTHSEDVQAKIGLSRCLDYLMEMKAIWPTAAVFYELLNGARVNRTIPALLRQGGSSRRAHDNSAELVVESGSSKNGADLFRSSPYATLTYSLGLDPNIMNNAFVPSGDLWPLSSSRLPALPHLLDNAMDQTLASLNNPALLPSYTHPHPQLGPGPSSP